MFVFINNCSLSNKLLIKNLRMLIIIHAVLKLMISKINKVCTYTCYGTYLEAICLDLCCTLIGIWVDCSEHGAHDGHC